ncbi:hypothetical protein HDV03_002978 [Kappamyces sp. JEL0829]|nr:hypothetical protein HDV03_002978 [Kappamyces sp. JEL0829]
MGWEESTTIRINTPPLRIWEILQKVSEWPVWDTDLKQAVLDDPSRKELEGAEGTLEMAMGKSFRFRIQNLKPERHVEYNTALPGAGQTVWYWDFKAVQDDAATTELRMGVTCSGWASFVYKLILQKKCAVAFGICTKNLKDLAEKGAVGPKP